MLCEQVALAVHHDVGWGLSAESVFGRSRAGFLRTTTPLHKVLRVYTVLLIVGEVATQQAVLVMLGQAKRVR